MRGRIDQLQKLAERKGIGKGYYVFLQKKRIINNELQNLQKTILSLLKFNDHIE